MGGQWLNTYVESLLAALMLATAGCSSTNWLGGAADVAVRRKQRLIEAAERFEKHRDEAQWQAAAGRLRHGDPDAARDQLDGLLARNPDHHNAQALLNEIDRVEQVGYSSPAEDSRWATISDSAAESASLNSSASSARDALTARPNDKLDDPQAALDQAVDALQSNQAGDAVEFLREALGQFPSSAALWRALGAAQLQRGEFESAQSALHQALSLDNPGPLAYFLMGQALQGLGHGEQAQRYFQTAADLDGRYAM